MTLLGIEFPPISHLTRWPDILFEDTPYAINKTVLIYLASVVITLAFFFAAARRAQLVPRGVQNLAESSVEFVREGIILQTIGPEGMGYLPFLTTSSSSSQTSSRSSRSSSSRRTPASRCHSCSRSSSGSSSTPSGSGDRASSAT